jgi:menaquinol-cytochrome c reductase iron-sulfur subunit
MAEMDDVQLEPRAERFERYLDALLAGGRPSPDDISDRDEAEMARRAAALSAAAAPKSGAPDPAFIEQLRMRMRQADQGIAAVQEPLPMRPGIGPAVRDPGRVRVTRRQLLGAAVTGMAGMAAGAAAMTIVRPVRADEGLIWDDGSGLVPGADFEWVPVAQLEDIPHGGTIRFNTGAFNGFVVNDAGRIRAFSSVCTHMGCTLHFREEWQDFRCPCHGASFNLEGRLANGRDSWRRFGAYKGDQRAYPIDLPDLVRPEVLVQNGTVLIKTARV